VTELSPEETESVTGGYGKSISHVIIGLKTVKGTKQLKLDPTIYDALIKEKVRSSLFLCFSLYNDSNILLAFSIFLYTYYNVFVKYNKYTPTIFFSFGCWVINANNLMSRHFDSNSPPSFCV
jgi:hypothetical protein